MKRCTSLALLAEYIGDAATVRLSATFGGTELKIPVRSAGRTWSKLLGAIGQEAAAALVESFAGETLYIPRNAADEMRQRRAEILAALEAGETPADIARRMTFTIRYSERWVRKIAADARVQSAQIQLELD